MSKGGRPRKIRSGPTSGIGGRPFTEAEKDRLLTIGEQFGLDRENPQDCIPYLDVLWHAYGSYCATENALAKQVGVEKELFDLETLLQRARAVLALIRGQEDLIDPQRCVKITAALLDSLHAFPNLVNMKISEMEERPAFLEARDKLRINVVRVRWWDMYRQELIRCLEVLIDVCERVESPETFTKRTRQAREMFEEELVELYLGTLHPLREANWREVRDNANDPPPPASTEKFAHEVMRVLGVKFESKGVSR